MLKQLHRKFPQSEIAIIGSGPSAKQFSGQGDVSIAVNGAALLEHQFDFFLYGDRKAPEREWSKVDCAQTRVVAHHVAATDELLYPKGKYPDLERVAKPQSVDQIQLPPPVAPHLHFQYEAFELGKVSRNNNFLMYGGTISCCAVQLAFMLGAKRVLLFGCEYSHQTASYFRFLQHTGSISDDQRNVMNLTLAKLRQVGVAVAAFGKTTLEQVDQRFE